MMANQTQKLEALIFLSALLCGCWDKSIISYQDEYACSFSRRACLRLSACNPEDPTLALKDAEATCEDRIKEDCRAVRKRYRYQIRSINLPLPSVLGMLEPGKIVNIEGSPEYLENDSALNVLTADIDGDGKTENRLGLLLNLFSNYTNFNKSTKDSFADGRLNLYFDINVPDLTRTTCGEIRLFTENSPNAASLLITIESNGHLSSIPNPQIPSHLEQSLFLTLPIFGSYMPVTIRGLKIECDIYDSRTGLLDDCKLIGSAANNNLPVQIRQALADTISEFLMNYQSNLESYKKGNLQEKIIFHNNLLDSTIKKFFPADASRDQRLGCIKAKGCCNQEATGYLCKITDEIIRASAFGPLFEFDLSVLDKGGRWTPHKLGNIGTDGYSMVVSFAAQAVDRNTTNSE